MAVPPPASSPALMSEACALPAAGLWLARRAAGLAEAGPMARRAGGLAEALQQVRVRVVGFCSGVRLGLGLEFDLGLDSI